MMMKILKLKFFFKSLTFSHKKLFVYNSASKSQKNSRYDFNFKKPIKY